MRYAEGLVHSVINLRQRIFIKWIGQGINFASGSSDALAGKQRELYGDLGYTFKNVC